MIQLIEKITSNGHISFTQNNLKSVFLYIFDHVLRRVSGAYFEGS